MLTRKRWMTQQMVTRIDDRLIAWLQQRANEERMSVSALVRLLIEREANRDLPRRAEDTPDAQTVGA